MIRLNHHAVLIVVRLLALALTLFLAGPSAADEPNLTEECARRTAIADSLAKVESAVRVTAEKEAALLAQLDAVETQIKGLLPIAFGACGDHLGIGPLRNRLDQARDAVQMAAAEERHRKAEAAAAERQRKEAERQRKAEAEEAERQRKAEEQRRREIAAKSWPDQIKKAVVERKIRIGMTNEQVTAAWGRPEKVNETIRATGRDEQWIYSGSTYLYFSNGTLTTIQRSR
jgi:hypothetical protein